MTTSDAVTLALQARLNYTPDPIPTKEIVSRFELIVSEVFQVPIEDIRGRSRERRITHARHALIYWLNARCDLSPTQIARKLSLDHTSVNHALESVRMKLKSDMSFRAKMNEIQARYRESL